jgi:hypothetical protein
MITEVGRWRIDHDPDATKSCYELCPRFSCACPDCHNFLIAFDVAFHPEFQKIASELGIDLRKPSELVPYGREAANRHVYGGWYHIVGVMLSGEDAWKAEDDSSSCENFLAITKSFRYGFSNRSQLLPDSFKGKQIVQLEFMTRVPWVANMPEPT